MWIHKCEAGEYVEDSLFKLLVTIFHHRFGHFIKGEGFVD